MPIVEFGSVIDNGHVLNCTFDSNRGSCVISYSDAINGSVINCSFIDNWGLEEIVSFSELNLLLPETGDVIILKTPAGERYSYEEKIVNYNIVNGNIPEDYLNDYRSIELISDKLIVNALLESNEDDKTDEYTIKVNIAGKTYSPSSIERGSARFDLSDLIEGNYAANVYYCYSKYYKGYNYARSIVNITVPIIIGEKEEENIPSSDPIPDYKPQNGGEVPGSTSKTVKVIAKKVTPKLTAKKATFKVKTKTKKYTATLKTNKNKVMKNIKLTLKVNGKTYTAKTNSKGKAIFKIKNLKKKGTFKATIIFKGNKNYNKVSKTVNIKIK